MFCNLIFIGNAIVVPSKHQIDPSQLGNIEQSETEIFCFGLEIETIYSTDI